MHLILTKALALSYPIWVTLGRLWKFWEPYFHCLKAEDDDICPHEAIMSDYAFYVQHRAHAKGPTVFALLILSLIHI
mgnify:CR=1 FL=1